MDNSSYNIIIDKILKIPSLKKRYCLDLRFNNRVDLIYKEIASLITNKRLFGESYSSLQIDRIIRFIQEILFI